MNTDPWLSRLIAGTVCLLALLMAGTACWQAVNNYETDKNIHDLLYLIVGGLLSQVTVHAVQAVKDGMQNVQVPAPLVPADALAAPDEVAPVDGGAGELRIVLLFAVAGLLALIAYDLIAPHL